MTASAPLNLFQRLLRQSLFEGNFRVFVVDDLPIPATQIQTGQLRVNILEPKGLEKEGDKVKAGQAAESGKGKWGKGFAIMGKGGEVKWEITIEKGKQAKLVLEYEARIPSGQKIVGLD